MEPTLYSLLIFGESLAHIKIKTVSLIFGFFRNFSHETQYLTFVIIHTVTLDIVFVSS